MEHLVAESLRVLPPSEAVCGLVRYADDLTCRSFDTFERDHWQLEAY